MSQYTAYLLTDESRRRLMARFPPSYALVKADHITHRHPSPDFADLHWADRIEVIGVVDDKTGLQALLARIDGETDRPDGNYYHITWSLAPDRLLAPFLRGEDGPAPYEARHSNNVINYMRAHNDGKISCRWLEEPFVITAMPAHIEHKNDGERVINILPRKVGAACRQGPPHAAPGLL